MMKMCAISFLITIITLIKTSMMKAVNDMAKKKQLPLPLYEEVKELNESLFNDQSAWDTPSYIKENMVHTFRYYQDAALRFFHYSQVANEFRFRNVNHVLFNMAT